MKNGHFRCYTVRFIPDLSICLLQSVTASKNEVSVPAEDSEEGLHNNNKYIQRKKKKKKKKKPNFP